MMKPILFLSLLIFCAQSLTATHWSHASIMDDSKPEVVFKCSDVEISCISSTDAYVGNILDRADYDSVAENVKFNSCKQISVIRIFNSEGLLEFQLPISSRQVIMNKSLFSEGSYTLGFVLEGEDKVHLANVTFF